ncbi:hypothetical protein Syun_019744 [Stephania yunnanensis]|uniref:Uncharacterized protein n=1 Tax=Stephania yunnanensis TaxID=152371 RepID=A0AAP0IUL4_9MAGN
MSGINSLHINTATQVNSAEVKNGSTNNWNTNNVKYQNGNAARTKMSSIYIKVLQRRIGTALWRLPVRSPYI